MSGQKGSRPIGDNRNTIVKRIVGSVSLLACCLLSFDPEGLSSGCATEVQVALLLGGALGLVVVGLACRGNSAEGFHPKRGLAVALALVGLALVAACRLSDGVSPVLCAIGAFILSAALAACHIAWVEEYSRLHLTQALWQASLACLAAGAIAALASFAPYPVTVTVAALCAAVGVALSPGSMLDDEGDVKAASDATSFLATPILTSVPVLGSCLVAFSVTSTIAPTQSDVFVMPSFALFAAVGAAALAVAVALRDWHESRLPFVLFRVAVPAVFLVALFVKVIPVDAISYGLYLQVIVVCFRVALLSAFLFCVYMARTTGAPAGRVVCPTLIAFAASAVVGIATNLLPSEGHDVVLGIVTSLFLLYSAFSLGRDVVLYNKPVDIDEPAPATPPELEEICAQVGVANGLSTRESEVLVELAHGHSSGYIAQSLCISSNTARTHMKNIYRKLGVNSREQLLDRIWQQRSGV